MLGIFARFPYFVSGPLTTSQYDFPIRQLFYYILPPPFPSAPEFKGLAVTANEAEKKNFSSAFFSQNAVVDFGSVIKFTCRTTHSVKLVVVCFEGKAGSVFKHQATKGHGGVEEYLHEYLYLATHRGMRSASSHGRLNLSKEPQYFRSGRLLSLRASLGTMEKMNLLSMPGIVSRSLLLFQWDPYRRILEILSSRFKSVINNQP